MSDENASDEKQTSDEEQAPEEFDGFETDFEAIGQDLLPAPAMPLDDPANALDSIDEWNETWLSIVDDQDSETIVLSVELKDFIERTNYLARWCESAGLDSTPMIQFSHAARDTYYAFRPTLPHIPDAVWVLLERLKYRLQPFTLLPSTEKSSATTGPSTAIAEQPTATTERSAAIAKKRPKSIPPDEANLLVRDYLKKNPGAPTSQVAKAVGIAQGRLPLLTAWQVEMRRRKANKPSAPKQPRALTRQMLEAIGRTNDPSAQMEAEEVAWQEIIAAAETRDKLTLLQDRSPEEKKTVIDAYIRMKSNQFGLLDGDS